MTALYVLVLVAAVVLGAWGAISPRGQWWALQAWRYSDPEANEPSETAYLLTRLGSIVATVFFVGLAVVLVLLPARGR